MNDPKVGELIARLRPRVDLAESVAKKLKDIVHNCGVAFDFVGPYMEQIRQNALPEDVQLGLVDVMREALELRLKCAKLLALDKLEELPVAKIDQEWEGLCTSISFVCLQLDPESRERVDAVL
jgi:hypothetical protein